MADIADMHIALLYIFCRCGMYIWSLTVPGQWKTRIWDPTASLPHWRWMSYVVTIHSSDHAQVLSGGCTGNMPCRFCIPLLCCGMLISNWQTIYCSSNWYRICFHICYPISIDGGEVCNWFLWPKPSLSGNLLLHESAAAILTWVLGSIWYVCT